jgi:hypothetical protein
MVKQRKQRNSWIPVRSSAVRKVRYKRDDRKLDLLYWGRNFPYEYLDVPRSKFHALMEAESKGKFVTEEIKPKHPYKKLSTED